MTESKIQKGDKVKVHFYTEEGIRSMKGIVVYIPQDTGDSWRILAINGTINYVQMFTVMTKITWVDKDIPEAWYVGQRKRLAI